MIKFIYFLAKFKEKNVKFYTENENTKNHNSNHNNNLSSNMNNLRKNKFPLVNSLNDQDLLQNIVNKNVKEIDYDVSSNNMQNYNSELYNTNFSLRKPL